MSLTKQQNELAFAVYEQAMIVKEALDELKKRIVAMHKNADPDTLATSHLITKKLVLETGAATWCTKTDEYHKEVLNTLPSDRSEIITPSVYIGSAQFPSHKYAFEPKNAPQLRDKKDDAAFNQLLGVIHREGVIEAVEKRLMKGAFIDKNGNATKLYVAAAKYVEIDTAKIWSARVYKG